MSSAESKDLPAASRFKTSFLSKLVAFVDKIDEAEVPETPAVVGARQDPAVRPLKKSKSRY
ncbi:hypothetical protein EBO34_20085 [Alteribacter keqinensis]|uniref:Uncharacterized protein n=1 Tax=Alteribacter keqinensis TaxID=2483800 RepID=A0A3M7TKP7_9BACI|nr:hypothetical protein EBO34_20085 [Alteribacter keqinensis]